MTIKPIGVPFTFGELPNKKLTKLEVKVPDAAASFPVLRGRREAAIDPVASARPRTPTRVLRERIATYHQLLEYQEGQLDQIAELGMGNTVEALAINMSALGTAIVDALQVNQKLVEQDFVQTSINANQANRLRVKKEELKTAGQTIVAVKAAAETLGQQLAAAVAQNDVARPASTDASTQTTGEAAGSASAQAVASLAEQREEIDRLKVAAGGLTEANAALTHRLDSLEAAIETARQAHVHEIAKMQQSIDEGIAGKKALRKSRDASIAELRTLQSAFDKQTVTKDDLIEVMVHRLDIEAIQAKVGAGDMSPDDGLVEAKHVNDRLHARPMGATFNLIESARAAGRADSAGR